MTEEEKRVADEFMAECKRDNAKNILGIVKVDARKLLAFQQYVCLTHSDEYCSLASGPDIERLKDAVRIGWKPVPIDQIPIRQDVQYIVVNPPHNEFYPRYDLAKKHLELGEGRRMLSVSPIGKRLLLWNGYHRTFALLNHNNPELSARYVFAVLLTDAEATLGRLGSELFAKRDLVRGPRPALFEDFFNADLCMTVSLRKWKPQLRVNKWTGQIERQLPDAES